MTVLRVLKSAPDCFLTLSMVNHSWKLCRHPCSHEWSGEGGRCGVGWVGFGVPRIIRI